MFLLSPNHLNMRFFYLIFLHPNPYMLLQMLSPSQPKQAKLEDKNSFLLTVFTNDILLQIGDLTWNESNDGLRE